MTGRSAGLRSSAWVALLLGGILTSLGSLARPTTCQAAPADAQGGDPAKAMADAKAAFERGETFYRQGEFRKALEEYKRALSFKRFPAFVFNIAQCHRHLGEHQQALFFYRLFLSEVPSTPNRSEVERRIQEMDEKVIAAQQAAKQVGRLSVVTRPRGAAVRLDKQDGAPVGTTPTIIERVPAGAHVVVIRLPGYHEVTKRVEVQMGQIAMLEMDLQPLVSTRRAEPDPRARNPPGGDGTAGDPRGPWKGPEGGKDDGPGRTSPFYKRWWFWTGVAVTVGLFGASGGTGGLAKSRADHWNDPSYPISDPDAYKRSIHTLAVTTDALWIAGAVVGVGTLVGALVVGKGRPEAPRAPRAIVTPSCGATGCGLLVQGRF